MTIGAEYKKRKETYLDAIAINLQSQLSDKLKDVSRIDRISTRVKDTVRFVEKSEKKEKNGKAKYEDPLVQIQDQIGARIIVLCTRDVGLVERKIKDYYRFVEKQKLAPESDSEFGYEGKHYVLRIPQDVIDDGIDKDKIPQFFELQIKTLFQHAWSEANHNLGYKPDQCLTSHQKRKLAFAAAQAWGADYIFSELLRNVRMKRGRHSKLDT